MGSSAGVLASESETKSLSCLPSMEVAPAVNGTLLMVEGAWLVVGSLFAAWWDDREMKKPVPFPDMPSLLSTKSTRIFSFLLLTAFGPAIVLSGFVVATVQTLYARYRLIRARRRLKKTCDKLGPFAQGLYDEILKRSQQK